MVRVLVSSTRCSMKRAAVPSILVAVVLLAVAVIAEAQQQAKVSKIGWLSARPASNSGQEVIVRMLRDLGYVEGQNIAFEYRYANNKLDRFPALADELVRLKVDVLLTPGTPGALALKNTTKTIPIVFADVTDPVAAGLVDSLARPGGNITGFSSIEAVLAGKRLELLKEAVPKISRVAVLWNPYDPSSAQQWKESQLAARELGLQLHSMEVTSADQFESAFKEANQVRSSGLFVVSSALAFSNQNRIADQAIKNRWPAIYTQGSFCGEPRLDVLWPRPGRTLPACRGYDRQDSQRYKASRHSRRAADEV